MDIFYATPRVERFAKSIDKTFQGNMLSIFALLSARGNELAFPHSRALGRGLFELRIVDTIQIRFFYTFRGDMAIILHGFIKKTQQIPHKEIEYARKVMKALSS